MKLMRSINSIRAAGTTPRTWDRRARKQPAKSLGVVAHYPMRHALTSVAVATRNITDFGKFVCFGLKLEMAPRGVNDIESHRCRLVGSGAPPAPRAGDSHDDVFGTDIKAQIQYFFVHRFVLWGVLVARCSVHAART